jgi:hypothetical protein
MSKTKSEDPNIITHEIVGAPGQAVDLFDVKKSDDTKVLAVDKDGKVVLTRLYRAQGNATIVAGDTYVVVTHGMGTTPSANDITVTPQDTLYGRTIFVDTLGATTFRINISSLDLADHVFGWEGDV